MRTFLCLCLTLGLGVAVVAEDAKAVREVAVKIDGQPKGKATEPTVITSADELTKAITDETARDAVKKAVDFSKEKVLFFAWSGSGGDRITATTEKKDDKEVVIFNFKAGLTRDYRGHHKVFVLGKDTKYEFSGKR